MTYFDCFRLVGRLEFHVCAVRTSNRQYFWEIWQGVRFPFSINFFRLRQPVTKILRQLYKTQFIGVPPPKKNLKIAPLRSPPPPLYQCCGSVICPQHGLGVICRPINIDWKGEGKNFAKSGCLNIFCDWL